MNNTLRSIAAVVVIIVVLLGGYVAGYVWMSAGIAYADMADSERAFTGAIRFYPHAWQTVLFTPAAWVETWLTGDYTITKTNPEHFEW